MFGAWHKKGMLMAAFAAWAGLAAASGPEEGLTWEQCVNTSRELNSSLKSAHELVKSKESVYFENFNSLLPGLSLSYGESTSDSNPGGRQHQLQGGLQWDLFNWKDYAGLQAASAALEQARCDQQLASAQLRSQLRRAFFQLLFSQEQIQLLEEIRKIRRTNAEMVDLSYNSGRESKGNQMITQADLASAEADLVQAKRSLRVSQAALNHALGRTETAEGLRVIQEFYTPKAPGWEEIESRLPGLPQIRKDEAAVASSRAAVEQARSQALPNVSAAYARTAFGDSFFPQNREWSASISLNWPIFSSGPLGTYFAMTAAGHQLDKAEADREADRHALRAALETAWSGLLQGIDQIQVQRQYLEAAGQRNAEAGIEYANGLMTFENWNQVVASWIAYKKQYLNARLNAVLSETDWDGALETMLEDKP